MESEISRECGGEQLDDGDPNERLETSMQASVQASMQALIQASIQLSSMPASENGNNVERQYVHTMNSYDRQPGEGSCECPQDELDTHKRPNESIESHSNVEEFYEPSRETNRMPEFNSDVNSFNCKTELPNYFEISEFSQILRLLFTLNGVINRKTNSRNVDYDSKTGDEYLDFNEGNNQVSNNVSEAIILKLNTENISCDRNTRVDDFTQKLSVFLDDLRHIYVTVVDSVGKLHDICLEDCLNEEGFYTECMRHENKLNQIPDDYSDAVSDATIDLDFRADYDHTHSESEYNSSTKTDSHYRRKRKKFRVNPVYIKSEFDSTENLGNFDLNYDQNYVSKTSRKGLKIDSKRGENKEQKKGSFNFKIKKQTSGEIREIKKTKKIQKKTFFNFESDKNKDSSKSIRSELNDYETEMTIKQEELEPKSIKGRKGIVVGCEQCGVEPSSKMKLSEHMKKKHPKIKPECCEQCGEKVKSRNKLYEHIKEKHPKKPVFCEQCSEEFSCQRKLSKHMREKHPKRRPECCKKCGEKVKSKVKLYEHMKAKHPKKPVSCEQCGEEFSCKSKLYKHKREKHPIVRNNSDMPCQCDICGTVVPKRKNLARHKMKHTKKQVCDICGRKFSYPAEMRRHRTWHFEERNFLCIVCGARFKNNASLSKHGRVVHSTERNFACDQCTEKFKLNAGLQRHILEVHCARTYLCPYCPKAFANPYNLRIHIKSHVRGTLPVQFGTMRPDSPTNNALLTQFGNVRRTRPFIVESSTDRPVTDNETSTLLLPQPSNDVGLGGTRPISSHSQFRNDVLLNANLVNTNLSINSEDIWRSYNT